MSGIKRGDTVALMMDNRPEYVAIWLGLAKVGIVTALVNCNLRDQPLLHALQIVKSKAIVFSSDFVEGLALDLFMKFIFLYQFFYCFYK